MSAAHARHRRSGGPMRRRVLIVVAIVAVVVIASVLIVVGLPPRQSSNTGASKSAAAPPSPRVKTTAATASSTTTSLPANSSITVSVLNASDTNGLAAQTATLLTNDGFAVSGIGNASSKIPPSSPSEIYYGAGGLPAAHALGHAFSGPVTYLTNATLTGSTLILWVAAAPSTVTTTTATTG